MNPTETPRRLVLVLVDGLRDDTARRCMGFLLALLEAGRARWDTLRCELPSLSRPLYATVLAGRRPVELGVVSNAQAGLRCDDTLFDELHAQGRRSAVAAYHWFYELLAGEVFEPARHRSAACAARGVAAGRWYYEDDYPDSHLLVDAEDLRRRHAPDLLFVHPMGLDNAGHLHGGESSAYEHAARRLDQQLALRVPEWLADGYDVVLTSDHGMSVDRTHGGDTAAEREVPFVWLPHDGDARREPADWPRSQLGIRRFALARLAGA
ncbi:MAG: alkaline phosphatase family protein [Pelomonas sp.]|nr:alkaline phosphatase family protein [Roseateles sp.]